ncbi:MAG: rRNA pseudouridine synthase [Bdellovibrionales bacterium]|nr:rRNA pseudouridine synthase [Bdellovibrionales bacterium]
MAKTVEQTNLIRLNKYLADHGIASRRKADEMIDEGLVQVNGRTVYELGVKIDPDKDKVKVKGKLVMAKPQLVYFVFNKPKNVVTSTADPQGRPVVLDYFKKVKKRIFPVGRLDWDTEGLLLMTNDGDFANEIAHPSSKVPKTYHAKLDGIPNDEKLQKLTKGVSIVGGKVKALKVKKLSSRGSDKKAWIEITITEGKNRQVKKMFEKIGFSVVKLKRVSIGSLKLAGLKPGDYRPMTQKDLENLFK